MYHRFFKNCKCFSLPSHKPLKHTINTRVQWKQSLLSMQTKNSPTAATLFIVTAHLQLQIDLIGALNEEKPAAAWKLGKTYSPNEKLRVLLENGRCGLSLTYLEGSPNFTLFFIKPSSQSHERWLSQ